MSNVRRRKFSTAATMTDFSNFVNPQTSSTKASLLVEGASACLDRFTAAFNSCDSEHMDSELHFPHVMYSGAEFLVWDQSGQHSDDFFTKLKSSGWSKTQYERKEPVLVSANKVHFVVEYTRRDVNGLTLTTHTNLWIATLKDGKWGIVLGSY